MKVRQEIPFDRRRVSALILAGGHSSRMNFPKARLPFTGRYDFLEHLVESYIKYGVHTVAAVTNKTLCNYYRNRFGQRFRDVLLVANNDPDRGRMYSIRKGLDKLDKSDYIIVHNVDNPFVKSETIDALIWEEPIGYARPVCGNRGGHPIVISKDTRDNILNSPDSMTLKEILHAYDGIDVRVKDLSVLQNINTPRDYYRVFGRKVPKAKEGYEFRVY